MKFKYIATISVAMLAGCEYTSQLPSWLIPPRPTVSVSPQSMTFCPPMTQSGTYDTVTKKGSTTVIYSCNSSAYTITKSGKNVIVTLKPNKVIRNPVVDTLVNVNKIVFNDITYLVDADGNLTDAAPKVNIFISSPKVHVGEKVTVSWDSANVTNCIGSDGLIGVKPNVGSSIIEPTAGGQFKYSISCTPVDGGPAIYASVSLIVPMPVYKTSYENIHLAKVELPQVLHTFFLGLYKIIGNDKFDYPADRSIAFADFTQEGKFTFVISQFVFDWALFQKNTYVYNNANLLFLQREGENYIDISDKLIPNPDDRRVCRGPSDPLIADFNGDRKPDIFLTCTGGDLDPSLVATMTNAEYVEALKDYQYVFLSQPDGTYKKIKTPFKFYGHGGSAGDLNGDGFIDVIVTNASSNEQTIIALMNDGRGNFTIDNKRFNIFDKSLYTVELLDVGRGVLDVIAGGTPDCVNMFTFCIQNLWIKNNGNGIFVDSIPLPDVYSARDGKMLGLILSVFYENGFLYINQVSGDYHRNLIQKIKLTDMTHQTLWEKLTPFTDAWEINGDTLNWGYVSKIYKNSAGNIVPMMPCTFRNSDVKYAGSICGVRVKL
jgi:hypothetical protein